MSDQWDGVTERRRTPPVVEEVGKRVAAAIDGVHQCHPELNMAQQLVIAAVVVVMLAMLMINQFRLMDSVGEHRDATRTFQRELVCLLLVEPENRSKEALTRCGLIQVPGER